jgi:hypothetical protein
MSPSGTCVSGCRPLVAALLLLAFALGCSTTKKADWDSRVGSYTYDQAVIDLGPPDRVAEISDGFKVAEWYQGSGSSFSVGVGFGSVSGGGGHGTGVGVGQSVTTGPKGKYLQLTFDKEGKLARWQKITR